METTEPLSSESSLTNMPEQTDSDVNMDPVNECPNDDLENAAKVEVDVIEHKDLEENNLSPSRTAECCDIKNDDLTERSVEVLDDKTDINTENSTIANGTNGSTTKTKDDQTNDMEIEELQESENASSPVQEEISEIGETSNVQGDIVESDNNAGPPDPSYYFWQYKISRDSSLKCLIQTDKDEFGKKSSSRKGANYMKGCKWAPDGSCLLSCSDDDTLRIFNFPTSFSSIQDWNTVDTENLDKDGWKSALKVKEGGLIYDYCWYPLMSSSDPVSSCFLATSSLSPIHLWDAFSGVLRASYQPYNHLEQLVPAYSLAFGLNGDTIYAGFKKTLRIFNLTRPGSECIERKLKQQLPELNQFGIIASIAVNPALQSFYALGTFDKSIGLYYEDGSVICLLQGHTGGITHMKFSNDGMKLYTGGRKDSRLICWDMRQMGEAYRIFDRVVETHQRVYFDISADSRYLTSGGTDGIVKIWDLQSTEETPFCEFRGNIDCVNGASLNPYVPLLATSSGQRHSPEVVEDSDNEDLFDNTKAYRKSSCDIKLWKLT